MIPYGRQWIDEDDERAVLEALRSDWLTTGPAVDGFESSVASFCNAAHGVAVSSGTAALHAAMFALGVGPGDEVIVPPMTFAASANCALYMGATPIFADVDPDTLLLDPAEAEKKITPATKAIIGVDYAGQPCDWQALAKVVEGRNIALVADGCHALGAEDQGRRVGTLADLTVFSFHPVKHVATGEGGMVVTDDPALAERCRVFRNHGITTDHRQRAEQGSWFYEMKHLGYNYRITDIQCALGLSQMNRLERFLARRREIAARYDQAFADNASVRPLALRAGALHAYHLYVVRVDDRAGVYARLRERGVGSQIHYIPVHLHPYYREQLGTGPGLCPVAEAAYEEILSIPMYPALTDGQVEQVIEELVRAAA